MDANSNLPMQVGEVRGRLGALEERVGRHEIFVGDYLKKIDDKLDRALIIQEQGVTMQRIFRWVITGALSASGWLALLVKGH